MLGNLTRLRRLRPAPALVLAFGLILSGCMAQLAPPYDDALVKDLIRADEKALVLFSAVADGSEASEFPKFASQYEQLIGKFGSLQNQAEARPVPPLAARLSDQLSKYSVLRQVCGEAEGDPGSCVNSSPSALAQIVKNFTVMRSTHKTKGLPKDLVALFKNPYDISIHQALTVETALKRGPPPAN